MSYSNACRHLASCVLLFLSACATVPDTERLLSPRPDRGVGVQSAPCGGRAAQGLAPRPPGLAAQPLRVLSWNLHKSEDAGWQTDLARFAAGNDLLLLQEAVLTDELRDVVERTGHRWQMAGAFSMDGIERGVMIAARVEPLAVCTLRTFEPLFPLPKSALVARYALAGRAETLAVANLHGINFTLGLGRFTEQIEAVARELERHEGPLIFGGDFNTWSDERHEALLQVTQRLRLTPVMPAPDGRRRAFGRYTLDHFFVRGLKVEQAVAEEVKSSDHNPIFVTLGSR